MDMMDALRAMEAYLLWMMEAGYSASTVYNYERLLKHYLNFLRAHSIDFESAFSIDTLKAFEKERSLALSAQAVKGLARYLYRQKRISAPIEKPLSTIPAIYEQYLLHYRKTRQVGDDMVRLARRVIAALCGYLEQQKIDLSTLKIDHLDAFLRSYQAPYSASSRRYQRSCLRGFVGYLYREKNLHARDLAPMIVGAPVFGYENPPRFLNPGEIKRLFSSLSFSTPRDLRASAMLYLAYPLGLRPKEISRIRLDDIAFSKGKIALRDRKNTHPLQLPLPEDSLKAISAYIIGARPKSDKRALFLTLRAPCKELQPYSVSVEITACLRRANIPQTAYSLRHSYAQGLLEAGRSVFEIKEMLGHDRIQTTRRYLKIHVALMRKVLWDETL